MLGRAAAQTLMPRELDAVVAVQDLTDDQWVTTVDWLPGWTVTELLDHVGRAGRASRSVREPVAGEREMPDYPHPAGYDRPVILGNLKWVTTDSSSGSTT